MRNQGLHLVLLKLGGVEDCVGLRDGLRIVKERNNEVELVETYQGFYRTGCGRMMNVSVVMCRRQCLRLSAVRRKVAMRRGNGDRKFEVGGRVAMQVTVGWEMLRRPLLKQGSERPPAN